MCDMLHLCVDNTFRLEGSYLSRCLMGSPVMPIYSNLCIVLIKRLSLSTYLTIRQYLFHRFVDDTLAVVTRDENTQCLQTMMQYTRIFNVLT